MTKDYIHTISKDAERRVYSAESKVELRSTQNDSSEIYGYGSVFNSDSHVMRTHRGQEFIERIMPGAFDHLLNDEEIVILFNHDSNYPLGRNKRSAEVGIDNYGFWYRLSAPNSPLGLNIQESIKRGDVKGSSFSFLVSEKNQEWEIRKNEPSIRYIRKVDKVFDLGPVVFEAYPDTMVVTRNFSVFDDKYLADLAEMDLHRMKRSRR